MSQRLSTFGIVHRPNEIDVDFYQRKSGQVWIIHDGHCPRAHTADGLCACVDPDVFTLEYVDEGRTGRRNSRR